MRLRYRTSVPLFYRRKAAFCGRVQKQCLHDCPPCSACAGHCGPPRSGQPHFDAEAPPPSAGPETECRFTRASYLSDSHDGNGVYALLKRWSSLCILPVTATTPEWHCYPFVISDNAYL